MKKNSIRNKNSITAIILLMVVFIISSCKKNNVDPTGTFDIKIVNASQSSSSQSFTLADQVLVSGGLSFGNASDYINTNSGTRLVEQFKNANGAVTASGELYTANGKRFTVYLVGEGSSSRIKEFEDQLTIPPTGKVSVKFIHLSDGAPSLINIKNSSGGNLVSNLSVNIASGYSTIDPGTLTVSISGVASGNSVGTFSVPNLQAGKIYSIYLTGSSSNNLSIGKVLHN